MKHRATGPSQRATRNSLENLTPEERAWIDHYLNHADAADAKPPAPPTRGVIIDAKDTIALFKPKTTQPPTDFGGVLKRVLKFRKKQKPEG